MKKLLFICVMLVTLLSACGGAPSTPTNVVQYAPTSKPDGPGYPVQTPGSGYLPPVSDSGYPAPAATVAANNTDHFALPDEFVWITYPVAEAAAKKWRTDAVLIEIVRLRQMEANLGIPQGPLVWFFMFKSAGNPTSLVEFYVEVSEGQNLGSREAQPMFSVAPPYKKLPIPISSNLIEGRDAYNIYLQNGADAYIKGKGRVVLDFRLVYLEGTPNPVWSLFDASDINSPALISIDAVTKTVVEDPFAKYNK